MSKILNLNVFVSWDDVETIRNSFDIFKFVKPEYIVGYAVNKLAYELTHPSDKEWSDREDS